jgi:coenzyme PQQ precursor peptide PqqA
MPPLPEVGDNSQSAPIAYVLVAALASGGIAFLVFCASSRAEAVSNWRSILSLALRILFGPPKRCARVVGGEAGHKRILSARSVISIGPYSWSSILLPWAHALTARKEATMTWTTPTLVEICIGLEINGYLPAEF